MSFGLGGEYGTSSNESQSSGYNVSGGESFGSSYGENLSGSQSSSSSYQDPDSIWGPQSQGLQNLYGAAGNIFGGAGNQRGNQVFNQAQGAFNNLTNPGQNPALGAYASQIGRTLQQDWLPQIQGGAIQAGQLGGGRQGVAQGLALSQGQQQLTEAASMLYNQDQNRMLGALGQAGGLANLGMGIPWYNAQQYGGLLGRPTVLGGASGSESQSSAFGSGFDSASDYGYDFGYGEDQMTSSGSKQNFGIDTSFGLYG